MCDSETADLASARECPPTPGMIQPAGNPEKNHRTCKIGVPLLHIRSEGENSTPSMSAGEKARQKRLASSPPILGSRDSFVADSSLKDEIRNYYEQNRLSPPTPYLDDEIGFSPFL